MRVIVKDSNKSKDKPEEVTSSSTCNASGTLINPSPAISSRPESKISFADFNDMSQLITFNLCFSALSTDRPDTKEPPLNSPSYTHNELIQSSHHYYLQVWSS